MRKLSILEQVNVRNLESFDLDLRMNIYCEIYDIGDTEIADITLLAVYSELNQIQAYIKLCSEV